MTINEEYYRIGRGGSNSYPLLDWSGDKRERLLYKRVPVDLEDFRTNPFPLELGEPIPKNPIMVDYHSLPKAVISKRIVDVLEPLEVYGIQCVPAVVDVEGTDHPYWILFIHNQISCLDLQQSIYKRSNRGSIKGIKRLWLDEDRLQKIPLEERLIFLLNEDRAFQIFHESIVEKIMAIEPLGLKFWRVDQWSISAPFDK